MSLRRPRRRAAVRGRQGEQVVYRFVLARLDPARAALPRRPPDGRGRGARARRGHVPPRAAGRGVAGAVPPDPGRARLRHRRRQPEIQHGGLALRRRRGARRRCRRCRSTSRCIHMHRGDRGGNGQYLGVDPYFDDLFCMAAEKHRFMSVERIVETDDFADRGTGADAEDQPADDRRRHRGAVRRALHRVRPGLRPRRGVPARVRASAASARGVERVRATWLDLESETEYQRAVDARRAEGSRA